ncbi:MAG: hypothetical protein NC115_12920 [Bacteroidales bacterium]|nr:hypothetical protein [Bacteroidales bacterium]
MFTGLPLLDYGARFYNPTATRWTTMDPMAEKYYSVSPYAFCSGNPVNFVDPAGEKLYFAKGVSEEFKQQFAATIKFMNSKGTSGDIAKLNASDKVYYIAEATLASGQHFNPEEKTVYWDSNHITENEDYMWVSPATSLAHEMGHASEYDIKYEHGTEEQKKEFIASTKPGSDDQYGTKEERRAIEVEQRAAEKHGEIKPGQKIRSGHSSARLTLYPIRNLTPEEISKAVLDYNKKMY